jgi:hypothetical protein
MESTTPQTLANSQDVASPEHSTLPTLPSCQEYLFNYGRLERGRGISSKAALLEKITAKHVEFGGCKNSPLSATELDTIAVGVIELTPAPPKNKRHRSSVTHDQLKELVKNAPGDLVSGLIPEKSVNIIIGDSGLGKTPLLVQLALGVAAGIPFLGHDVRRAAVLYVDYENGSSGFDRLLDILADFLDLPKTPNTFRYLQQPNSPLEVSIEIRKLRSEFPELPILVIVDSMRGFDPTMESKNELAGNRITQLQSLTDELNASILFIHHIKKDGSGANNKPLPSLANSEFMDWSQRASGARSVINQSNVRFGIDKHNEGEAELIIKGHYKLRGPFGPIQIARMYDDEGEAVGYRHLIGVNLLPSEQRSVVAKLPDEFTFTQAVDASGKGPKTVAEWLRGWRGAGVVEKRGKAKSKHSRYVKLQPTSAVSALKSKSKPKAKTTTFAAPALEDALGPM